MTNSILQKDNTELDEQLLDDLRTIENTLVVSENVDIDIGVEKQILAAAYRESRRPQKTAEYRFSFWRKLSLPLYIGAGFVFTVLAYNTLLLPAKQDIGGSESASTIISIQASENSDTKTAAPQVKEKRELPTLEAPDPLPKRVVTESNLSPIEIGSSDGNENQLIEQGIYTGNELKKAEFPEKEAWAREIIGLLRGGQSQRAKNELNRFKKIYPDYPIEEQIKVLSH